MLAPLLVEDAQPVSAPTAGPTAGPATEPGIQCPNCYARSHQVLFTRPAANTILRARKCYACGRRFRTAECVVAPNAPARFVASSG